MPIDATDNFYSDGAITLTHGSDIATGLFTTWSAALLPLDLIVPGAGTNGMSAVKEVISNTQIRLGRAWDGPTLTEVAYFSLRWTAHTDPRNYGPRLATYLARLDQVPPDLDAFLASIEAAIAAMAAHAEAAQDSADAAHADRVAAETARTGAETAGDAAQPYRDGAEDYRDWAQRWAGEMAGPVSGGAYSAQWWATASAGSAGAAADAYTDILAIFGLALDDGDISNPTGSPIDDGEMV